MNLPHKGQWRGALMVSLICAWINGWVNNRETGELKRHSTHYDVIVMQRLNGWTLSSTVTAVTIAGWRHHRAIDGHLCRNLWWMPLATYRDNNVELWWIYMMDKRDFRQSASIATPFHRKIRCQMNIFIDSLWVTIYWHLTHWLVYVGQATKVRLSCYLVLLSVDSKTR